MNGRPQTVDLVVQGLEIGTPELKELAKLAAAERIEALSRAETQAFRLVHALNQDGVAEFCAAGGFDCGFVPATQRFLDVPPSSPFYALIEEMAVRQITSGCGGNNYCPTALVTREQMAVFLVRAFNLPLP